VYAEPPNVGVSMFDMWVFAELDNLEYVLEKYRRGYIEPEQAYRSFRMFLSRCVHDEKFTRRALKFSGTPSYHETIASVVCKVSQCIDNAKAGSVTADEQIFGFMHSQLDLRIWT
jgi:hypothetical protein